ncbi:hypothetical protein MmTuc01_3284 [Methanosarcina mazei Tuc01]|uniref:Uncharacterized protein n=1 Tax=Methanosarcina mazei Tuc01 TaxID=1236903 RepID=M1QE69_METMZ|nr:hypothetical protein MmTuc01_3284 [Methanosarcina mazei Tuc01]
MYGETGNIQSINAFFQDAAFQKNRGERKAYIDSSKLSSS